jgi:hypothetical protein
MSIVKEEDENFKKILIINNDSKLEIILTKNSELIFYFNKNLFKIDKSNYEVYIAFVDLINEIKSCSFLGPQDNEMKTIISAAVNNNHDYHNNLKLYLQKKKEEIAFIQKNNLYHSIVKDNNIIWQSDEELTSSFTIKENKDNLLIIPSINMLSPYIIVSLEQSKQKPFNIPFINLFNNLYNLDYEYHQINIEEYLLSRK